MDLSAGFFSLIRTVPLVVRSSTPALAPGCPLVLVPGVSGVALRVSHFAWFACLVPPAPTDDKTPQQSFTPRDGTVTVVPADGPRRTRPPHPPPDRPPPHRGSTRSTRQLPTPDDDPDGEATQPTVPRHSTARGAPRNPCHPRPRLTLRHRDFHDQTIGSLTQREVPHVHNVMTSKTKKRREVGWLVLMEEKPHAGRRSGNSRSCTANAA